MASDAEHPASSDQATESVAAIPISDARRADLAMARTMEVAQELDKAKQVALDAEFELFVSRRKDQESEKKLRGEIQELRDELRESRAMLKKKEAEIVDLLRDKIKAEEQIRSAREHELKWKNVSKKVNKEFAEYQATAAPESSLGKRKATLERFSQPEFKKAKSNRIVPCIKCFSNNRPCDNVTGDCNQCVMRGLGKYCQRVMCKDFKSRTCKNKKCKFAHEDDYCHRLVPHMKLKRARPEEPFAQNVASGNSTNAQEPGDDRIDFRNQLAKLINPINSRRHENDEDSDIGDGINGVRI